MLRNKLNLLGFNRNLSNKFNINATTVSRNDLEKSNNKKTQFVPSPNYQVGKSHCLFKCGGTGDGKRRPTTQFLVQNVVLCIRQHHLQPPPHIYECGRISKLIRNARTLFV